MDEPNISFIAVFSGALGALGPWAILVLAWRYAPEEEDVDNRTADAFIETVATTVPYYLQFIQALTSTTCTLLVFGPQRTVAKGDSKFSLLAKRNMQCAFLVLAWLGIWADTVRLRSLMQSSLSVWQKLVCIVVILANSGNISTGMKTFGLVLLIGTRTEWMNASTAGMNINFISVMFAVQGPVYNAYMWIFFATFLYLWAAIITYFAVLFPTAVMYCWFCVPIGFLCYVAIIKLFLPVFLWATFKQPSEVFGQHLPGIRFELEALPEEVAHLSPEMSSAAVAAFPPSQVPLAGSDAEMRTTLEKIFAYDPAIDVAAEYERQHEVFLRTGSPLTGWQGYFVFSILGQFATSMVGTIGARLYLHGFGDYWGAIWTTISERHTLTYFTELRNSMGEALESSHTIAAVALYVAKVAKSYMQ